MLDTRLSECVTPLTPLEFISPCNPPHRDGFRALDTIPLVKGDRVMTNTAVPLCYYCKHLRTGVDDGDKRLVTCAAYPDGIPKPILEEFGDHRTPLMGDHGIQFEPSEMAMWEDIVEWERTRAWAYRHLGQLAWGE